jgi:transcriptional regulator with XRE-family HTH domain
METSGSEIVERIDAKLKDKNLKRQAVCDYAGCTPTAIVHWKKQGSIPAADTAIKIAQFLNVSVEWLITGQDPDGLPEEDRELLTGWHDIDTAGQELIRPMIHAAAEKIRNGNKRISS